MNDLMPNWGLLKSPMNWFFVAFALFLMGMIAHFIWKDKE